jgi:hypothetical protein
MHVKGCCKTSARLMHGCHSNIAKNTLNYIKKSV